MSRNYATELSARFVGCRVIAHARDETKKRDVRLYAMPESFDVVGVNDGIDCWIAPVSGDPFSAGVKTALETMWAKGYGLLLHEFPIETERYVAKVTGTPKQADLPLSPQPEPRMRRKAVLPPPEVVAPAATTGRRRVVRT